MSEKGSQQAKIKKGLGARRDATCFRLKNTIVIPAGTILRHVGDDDFAAAIGLGAGVSGELRITVKPGTVMSAAALDRVIA